MAVRVWRGVLAGVSAGALAVAGLVVAGPAPVASAQEEDVSGVVEAWGNNEAEQSTVPEGLGPVTDIAGGFAHSVAVLVDGSVRAWGWNEDQQADVPDDLGKVTAVAAGTRHSVALLADGSVRAWGANGFDQVNVPDDLGPVTAIAAGAHHSVALLENGTVRAWGRDHAQQVTVPGDLGEVKAVAAGGVHSMALLENGTVRAWGSNAGHVDVPDDLGEVKAIAAGELHSVALLADGTVEAWGDDTYNQSTVPDDLGQVAAVAAGARHTVALLGDGSVRAWGDNTYRQTDKPDDLGRVVGISAGGLHNLAIERVGSQTVVSSGSNPAVVGEPVELTATVSSDAGEVLSGTVEFTVDGAVVEGCAAVAVDGQGEATCAAPGAPSVGSYDAAAVYSGDQIHDGSVSEPLIQQTVAADTTTEFTVEPAEPVFGETVELTAVVKAVAPGRGAVDGSLEFTEGDTILYTYEFDPNASEDGSVATWSSTLDVGTYEFRARFRGSENFTASNSDVVTVTVGKASQSIDFEPLPDVEYGAEPFVVSAVASSGLDVSFAADGDCVVEASTVTVTGAGSCTVTAEQAGDANWAAAESVSRTFAVAKASQSIEFGELPEVTYGVESFEVSATASSGLEVRFGVSGMCVIDDSTVTVTGAGECTVTARQPGNSNWNAAEPVARTFPISGAPADVQVTGWEHVYDGEPHGVEVTTDPEGLDVDVSYDGSPEEPVDAGSYEVVVTVTDPNYVMDPVTGTMVIAKADQSITLEAPENFVFGAGAFEVTATASSELPVEVSAAGACTIEDRTVTPSGAGECVLTAEQGGDGNWNPAPAVTHTVIVEPAGSSTVLQGPEDVTVVGSEATFTATVTAPEGTGTPAGAITFTVDDGEGVEVELDADGVASWTTDELAVGEHTVTAEYAGQGDHAGSGSEPVEHEVVTAELSLTGLPGEVMGGDDVTVDVTGFVPGEDIEFVWHSDPVTVATVTADAVGAATASFTVPEVPAGAHRLVATGTGSGLTVEAQTTVVEPVEPTPEPTPTPSPEPELPDTGAGIDGPLGLGIALVLVSGIVMALTRRRWAGTLP